MHFAYIDESGSRGFGGSQTYSLGCVLVNAKRWPTVFDDVLAYRRYLSKPPFNVPVRAEIKANHLLQNSGAFRALRLGEMYRFKIYRGLMRLFPKVGLQAFAVVIKKQEMQLAGKTEDPRDVAWDYLLQRLERFTTKGPHQVLIFHDEGDSNTVRGFVRRARRAGIAGSAFGTGSLRRPALGILEDPIPRQSHHSYLIQLADLCAYAAFRAVIPPPVRPVNIVPTTMWDELGPARYTPVNALRGGPPAIVVWPQ